MSLSEGWSLSNVTRQLTVDVFASDPKEGRVISFSLSLSLLFRLLQIQMLQLSCMAAAGNAPECSSTCEQEDSGPGQGGASA